MRSPASLLPLLAAALLLGLPAQAQEVLESADLGVRIERDALQLRDEIRPPDDRDLIDTALVFTNTGHRKSRVACKAFDHQGVTMGRAWLKVPGLGLRYLLASDLANGKDFVGSVQCSTRGRVLGSAFLLAPGGVTDLPARQGDFEGAVRVKFPVVATR